MSLQWQTGIVRKTEQATHNTRRYWIELPQSPVFSFKPGQFITLDLPIHDQRNKRWRSYSISSAPGNDNLIELVIVNVTGGTGSKYIFDHITEGSILLLRGPQGVFVLPEILDKDIYFICTGTGIAPFRSMMQYIRNNQIPHKNLYLIFGTRTRADLLYADEMWQLEREIPGFSYRPTLSREVWDRDMGYVHPIYESLAKELNPSIFMLCGWRAMIDEARERILKMGFDKKDIKTELYG
jgi:CDP-4-dehydro-6-deoxyglucose reductase